MGAAVETVGDPMPAQEYVARCRHEPLSFHYSLADNIVLMWLNSLADMAFTQTVFSFVPPTLIDRAVTFRQGEALIAGKISPQPALLRFGARISEEGGADVPATWAHAR